MRLFLVHQISFFMLLFPVHLYGQSDQKMKYIALGDSYTIGESVEFIDRFPVQLVTKLRFKGLDFAMAEIIAKTGWTTDELNAGINAEHPGNNYDLVTLLIGVNNQYRGGKLETYEIEFEDLLKRAMAFAKGKKERVIVISIPDYGVTPFGQKKGRKKIAKEIDLFNESNLNISKTYGVAYVDVTEISRKAYRRMNLIAEDGLHPSSEMYAQWVEQILPVAVDILQSTD